jgi:hypothetical protein
MRSTARSGEGARIRLRPWPYGTVIDSRVLSSLGRGLREATRASQAVAFPLAAQYRFCQIRSIALSPCDEAAPCRVKLGVK